MRKNTFRSVISFAIHTFFFSFLMFYVVATGQERFSKDSEQLALWQQRVDGLQVSILKDVSAMEDADKALYYAVLAKILWKADSENAQTFIRKSIVSVVSSLESNEDSEFSTKLERCLTTIQLIATLDSQAAQSLSQKVAGVIEKKDGDKKVSADVLIAIALQVVASNPTLASQLGVKSLQYGTSQKLNVLILKLNTKESKLAENLFDLSLAAGRQKFDYSFVGGLGLIVFDETNGKTFSDYARRTYLTLLADLLKNAVLNQPDRQRCEVVGLITPILFLFDEYLLDQSSTVRQQSQVCLQFMTEKEKSRVSEDAPKTADDFISVARNTSDPTLKGHYFSRAVAILSQVKKYDAILSLLDGMTEPERKATAFGWDDWRVVNAYESALVSIQGKDLGTAYRTINKTPKTLRPYVRFRLAYKLSPVEFRNLILENLEEIRKEIGTFDISAKDAASNHLSLAALYLKIQPIEAEASFRTAVKFINIADDENPSFLPEKDYAPLRTYVPLAAELLEIDEYSIDLSLTKISSKRSRTRLRLGLLESSLVKLNLYKKRVDSANKDLIKGENRNEKN